MFPFLFNLVMFVFLTPVSQLGGVAWIIALKLKFRVLSFVGVYVALSVMALWIAPLFGRVPLSCVSDGPLQLQSWFYCALNRQYVTPEMADVANDLAIALDKEFPGTKTLALDGSFPFIAGFPLLPHLSHDDGEKLDFAFFYKGKDGYVPAATRSPIGYFAFEDGPTDCRQTFISMRWNLKWLQPFWRELDLDHDRMVAASKWFAQDERVGKVFLEPHLVERFRITSSKFRFQGCRAARHDDHFHIQL